MVSSVNGKITKNTDPDVTQWASKEDQKLFINKKNTSRVLIMGRNTYDVAKKYITQNDKFLRIIYTRHPNNFIGIPEKLEFTDVSPNELLHLLENRGYTDALLLGGSEINSLFLRNKLVDELHLTIEPMVFGKGKNLIADEELYSDMKLVEIQKLNSHGTLHLKYIITKQL